MAARKKPTAVPQTPLPAIGSESKTVADYTPRQKELVDMRDLPRTLLGGTKAMRKAGIKYLPRHPNEDVNVYNVRVAQTFLFNAFAEAVTKQSAKLFGKPVTPENGMPQQLQDFCENVDGQDRALTPFCSDLEREAFADGVEYILVDYPTMAPNASMADVRRAGARPYWVHIKADNVRGIRSEAINGEQVCTQFRFYECSCERDPDDPFKEVEVQRIRVLEVGRYVVYRLTLDQTDKREKWLVESTGTVSLPYIPVVPVYVNRVGYMEGAPPLASLAELNQEHWVSSSEQRNALTYSRFAMLKVKGVERPLTNPETGEKKKGITVGPSKVIYLPVNGDAGYVEHTGKGIEAGRLDLEAIERRMESAGMEIRVDNAGDVTATSAAIDSAETNAGMKAVAKALKDAVETALQYTADWMALGGKAGSVTVYEEFGDVETEVSLDQLLKMRAQREISQPTFWDECKRRHILSDEFDADAEQVLLAADVAADLSHMEDTIAVQAKAGGPQPPGGTKPTKGKKVSGNAQA
jgi:hypothetical protein